MLASRLHRFPYICVTLLDAGIHLYHLAMIVLYSLVVGLGFPFWAVAALLSPGRLKTFLLADPSLKSSLPLEKGELEEAIRQAGHATGHVWFWIMTDVLLLCFGGHTWRSCAHGLAY